MALETDQTEHVDQDASTDKQSVKSGLDGAESGSAKRGSVSQRGDSASVKGGDTGSVAGSDRPEGSVKDGEEGGDGAAGSRAGSRLEEGDQLADELDALKEELDKIQVEAPTQPPPKYVYTCSRPAFNSYLFMQKYTVF